MAGERRADAEGSQFQERWEAEYFSVECKEMQVYFICHQPFHAGGTLVFSHTGFTRARGKQELVVSHDLGCGREVAV